MRWLLLLLVVSAPGLYAEDVENVDSFTILPKALSADSTAVEIRLVANQPDLFSTSSTTVPKLEFGSGVKLVAGSFSILNPSEAKAIIDIPANVGGAVEARVTFYSSDGKTAIRQVRSMAGVIGPVTAGSQNISASVSVVALVKVNVEEAQTTGDMVLTGAISGIIRIAPPTGTLFDDGSEPVVSATGGISISEQAMAAGYDAFSFTVNNTDAAQTTVTIAGITLDTVDFSDLGGSPGGLAVSVTSQPLFGNEPLLLQVARTALETLENDEVVDEAPRGVSEPEAVDSGRDSTTNGATGGSNIINSGDRPDRRAERVGDANDTGRGRAPRVTAHAGASTPTESGDKHASSSGGGRASSKPHDPNAFQGDQYRPPQAGAWNPGRDSSPSSPGVGSISTAGDADTTSHSPLEEVATASAQGLAVSSRLFFADANFKPLASVVLEAGGNGERSQRVWVVLKRASDISQRVDTVTVTVKIHGESRQLTLVETGATTAEFRCAEAGIEITAAQK